MGPAFGFGFPRSNTSSLFEDLIDGSPGVHTTTSYSTGDGNTVHITRTVIGDDGSVRREMRFRTPNSEDNHHNNNNTKHKHATRKTSADHLRPDSTTSTPRTRSQSANRASSFNHHHHHHEHAQPPHYHRQQSHQHHHNNKRQQQQQQQPEQPQQQPTSSSHRHNNHHLHQRTTPQRSSSSVSSRGQPDGAPASESPRRRTTLNGGIPSYQLPTVSSFRKANNGNNSVNGEDISLSPQSPRRGNNYTQSPDSTATPTTPTGGTRPRSAANRSNSSASARRRLNNQHNYHQQQQHQSRMIQCPLCGKNFPKSVIEVHAANCEGKPEPEPHHSEPELKPEVLEVNLPPEKSSPPGRSLVNGSNNRVEGRRTSIKMVECPICNQTYSQTVIEEHAANCGEEVYV